MEESTYHETSNQPVSLVCARQ